MTWQQYHIASQGVAARAHDLARAGDPRAEAAFLEAAELEQTALTFLPNDKARTIGITAISAVSLFYKAGAHQEAADLAHRSLLIAQLPTFAKHELRLLLQSIWNEEAQKDADRHFSGSQILVSARGGQVLSGGAPMDVLLSKVQGIQSMVVRVAELLNDVPLRLKGPPSSPIADSFRPWLFQSPPGSYQFSVAIESPRQTDLFPVSRVSAMEVTETFLGIIKSACEVPEVGLADVVQSDEYRRTFLKLARNLAPTGKTIGEIAITGTRSDHSVVLSSQSRKALGTALRQVDSSATDEEEVLVQGVLRALDLNHGWVEVGEVGKPTRVYGMGDTVDDVIGPMVNQQVTVRARQTSRHRLTFVDIELDE